jgi:hypothetical protein
MDSVVEDAGPNSRLRQLTRALTAAIFGAGLVAALMMATSSALAEPAQDPGQPPVIVEDVPPLTVPTARSCWRAGIF